MTFPCSLTTQIAVLANDTSNPTNSLDHVFGAQTNDMGGTLVRTISLTHGKAKIGMKNLAYNIRRLAQLRRLNPCPA